MVNAGLITMTTTANVTMDMKAETVIYVCMFVILNYLGPDSSVFLRKHSLKSFTLIFGHIKLFI